MQVQAAETDASALARSNDDGEEEEEDPENADNSSSHSDVLAGNDMPTTAPSYVLEALQQISVLAHGSMCSAPSLVGLIVLALLFAAYFIVQHDP